MNTYHAKPRGCPLCRTPLRRIPRHLADRLISLLLPMWRCRCPAAACGWEGLVRCGERSSLARAWGSDYRRRPVLEASRGASSPPLPRPPG